MRSGHVTAGFCGCIGAGGTIALERTSPRMNAAEYTEILEEVLLLHLNALFGEKHTCHIYARQCQRPYGSSLTAMV